MAYAINWVCKESREQSTTVIQQIIGSVLSMLIIWIIKIDYLIFVRKKRVVLIGFSNHVDLEHSEKLEWWQVP